MILSALSFITVIFTIELAYRKKMLAAEYSRKLSHVICGFLTWYWSSWLTDTEYNLLLALFLVFFLMERRIRLLRSLHDIGRPSAGVIAYLAGLYILGANFYADNKFYPGLALMIVPDAVAGALTFARGSIYKDNLHSACVFYSSLMIALFIFPVVDAVVLSFIIAVTERYTPYGLDNITIPAVYGLLMKFS